MWLAWHLYKRGLNSISNQWKLVVYPDCQIWNHEINETTCAFQRFMGDSRPPLTGLQRHSTTARSVRWASQRMAWWSVLDPKSRRWDGEMWCCTMLHLYGNMHPVLCNALICFVYILHSKSLFWILRRMSSCYHGIMGSLFGSMSNTLTIQEWFGWYDMIWWDSSWMILEIRWNSYIVAMACKTPHLGLCLW